MAANVLGPFRNNFGGQGMPSMPPYQSLPFNRFRTRKLVKPKNSARPVNIQTRKLQNLKLRVQNSVSSNQPDIEVHLNLDMNDAEPLFNEKIIVEVPVEKMTGDLIVQNAEERAQFYLNLFEDFFKKQVEPRDIKQCFGVLFHRQHGPPLALDFITSLQNSIWQPFIEIVDETYEPIFILHSDGVKQVSPEEIKTVYKGIF